MLYTGEKDDTSKEKSPTNTKALAKDKGKMLGAGAAAAAAAAADEEDRGEGNPLDGLDDTAKLCFMVGQIHTTLCMPLLL